ncbi:MAG: polar amino acid transport system substrate-binding protein [Alteromonadaceae bacterium]
MKYLFSQISYLFFISILIQGKPLAIEYEFASIEHLIEQEVGRIVLPQMYRNIGIDITITPLPAKRAQFLANTGAKDGEIMRIETYGDENTHTIRVPTPYYYLETMPFILKGSNVDIHRKEDLSKYKLAKIRGVKHTNNITKGLTNVYEMNSTANMFRMLQNEKVDVVLTNTLDGNLILEKLGYDNIVSINNALAVLPLYHYIHEKNKALVPLIDQEILRLKKSGELKKLIKLAEQEVTKVNQR